MRKKGLDYEDWLAQPELIYLLDNIADAITPKTHYANKRGE